MNRTIKRTVTITITETWTIVWTEADDPLPQAPNSEGDAQAAPQAKPDNTLPDQPTKGPCPENTPPAPGEMVQPPDELPVSPATDRRRKRVRRRRTKDEQKRPADESHPLLGRLE